MSLKNKRTVLIAGGAGFIGSHVNKMLFERGYSTIVLDNLSVGSAQSVITGSLINGDISDESVLEQIFSTHHIDAVMHFAAYTDVRESVKNPLIYYSNNVANTLVLLRAMVKYNIKNFIFSSSAAVYGNPQTEKITEDHPRNPINPYGQSKLMVEHFLEEFDRAYGIRFFSLRYFNAAGGDPQKRIGYFPRKESNLIPLLLNRILEGNLHLTINGTDYSTKDGTCIRDFIHIEDLGYAHIIAMEKLLAGERSNYYNLGNGIGFSVKEVINAVISITGKKIKISEGPRRIGDPPSLIAESNKAQRELGWTPQYSSLQDMVLHAWQVRT